MNILVTGATGFIGRHLISRLIERDHRLIVLHHRIPDDAFDERVRVVTSASGALTPSMIGTLFSNTPFVLIHLAWHSPRETSYAVAASHLAQMAHLLEVTKGHLRSVISLGSADEYGAREGMLSPDTPSEGTLSPYGWGKKSARDLLTSYASESPTSAFWLRPFTVYGENQTGTMLLPYAVSEARARREARFSDGLQERDFIHVDDVIVAIEQALVSSSKGFHAVNLGWGKPVQIKRVLLDIACRLHAESFFKFGAVRRRVDEPAIRYADISQAKRLLNWTPTVTLEEGLARISTKGELVENVDLQNVVRG